MRVLLIPLLVFWLAGSLYSYSIDLAGSQTKLGLRTLVLQREAGATVQSFKLLRYEPNSGSAQAYVVLKKAGPSKRHLVGRAYKFESPRGTETWSVASRATIWDESRGDLNPRITPYWSRALR